jgi:hypothetical protein
VQCTTLRYSARQFPNQFTSTGQDKWP